MAHSEKFSHYDFKYQVFSWYLNFIPCVTYLSVSGMDQTVRKCSRGKVTDHKLDKARWREINSESK